MIHLHQINNVSRSPLAGGYDNMDDLRSALMDYADYYEPSESWEEYIYMDRGIRRDNPTYEDIIDAIEENHGGQVRIENSDAQTD